MRVVLKIGGSLIQDEKGNIRVERLAEYAKVILKLRKENTEVLCIIVGGGKTARKYIEAARKLKAVESLCDEIGIRAAQLNAQIMIGALNKEAYPTIPETLQEVAKAAATGKIVLVGGLQPGQSTNAVAALIAERLNVDILINATDVEGVYTKDPKKDPGAKKLSKITVNELQEIINETGFFAGKYKLFDPVALKILERSKIPTWIINGEDPKNVLRIIAGEKIGTLIVY
ncbi:MAG: UMP kinase [Candidatus Jordarchaeum sp.]|uniref:UMP kinase n=1 Tax=Candidatus Jordarchaeum sp. TaxID=2823881 RepID=UPI00404B6F08